VRAWGVRSAGRSWEISGPPHISQERSEGWLRKVQRGHWNDASGSVPRGDEFRVRSSLDENSVAGFGRTGKGVCRAGVLGWRLVALEMAALRTWVRVGLMPQARHGGSGVWALAVVGSKLEGTGFEKVQMVQTQVAVVAGGGSTGDARGAPSWACEAALLCGDGPARPGERGCSEGRFAGLGIRVILADDLRKPPCESGVRIR